MRVRRLGVAVVDYLGMPATLTIAAVVIVCFIAQRLTYDSVHTLRCECVGGATTMHISTLQQALAFSTSRIRDGQWWRVVTPNLVNGPVPVQIFGKYYDLDFGQPGLWHLAVNLFGLAYIGPFIERRLGWQRFVALAVATGALAYGSLLLLPEGWNLVDGTSGTVFGLYGVGLAVIAFERPTTRGGWAFVAGLAMLVWSGFASQPYITVHGHGGGIVSGIVLGTVVVARMRRVSHRPLASLIP